MAVFADTWQKIIYSGVSPDTSQKDKRFIGLTNFLLISAISAYFAFDALLYASKIISPVNFMFLTILMLACFLICILFIHFHRVFVAKVLLTVTIFLAIFVYNLLIGKESGVSLYFFPFFLATIYIFQWQTEKYYLIGLLLLPVALIFVSSFLNGNNATAKDVTTGVAFYHFNFIMSFLLMVANSVAVITEHNSFLKREEDIKINLQSLIDNTQGYIWSVDTSYRLIAYNKAFAMFVQNIYAEKCYEGFNVKTIIEKPNSAKAFPGIYTRVLGGEIINEEYFSNGNYFEMQASPLFDNAGKMAGATFHSQIITAKKLAEQDIIQSKVNLETLVDSIGNSTWSLTRDYKIIVASKLYREDMKRIFGADIIPGFDISTLFAMPDYPEEWKKQYKTVFSGQNIFEDYTFGDNYFELTAVPMRYNSKEIYGAVFFSRDISARKKTEQELNQSRIKAEEATVAKAQFLSNMSHELRTPLNGIIGLTNILLEEPYLPAQEEHIETLKYSGDHMLVLINDILDFNKIEAGKIVLENNIFNIGETIEKIHTFFSWEANKKNIGLTLSLDNAVEKPVYGDVTRLRQVLTNLISNAIKFTDNGVVEIETSLVKKLDENKGLVRFTIRDTGIGIPENKLSQIFESFSQADASTIRKYGGSGLGLTISKKILELMDAQLQVDSIYGKGSSFWFEKVFQFAEKTDTSAPQVAVSAVKDLKNISILVVEDNPINMLVVTRILEKWNVGITKANDGQQAINLLQQSRYDVILMDLQMPFMDGITATKHIRAQKITTPIIALTATVDENLLADVKKMGMNDVVQKPFSPGDLYEKIRLVTLQAE